MKKTTEQLIIEGKQVKEWRTLMGIKQIDMAKNLNTNQCNYSHMESGRQNLDWRYGFVRDIFVQWRLSEVKRLEEQINYLKLL